MTHMPSSKHTGWQIWMRQKGTFLEQRWQCGPSRQTTKVCWLKWSRERPHLASDCGEEARQVDGGRLNQGWSGIDKGWLRGVAADALVPTWCNQHQGQCLLWPVDSLNRTSS